MALIELTKNINLSGFTLIIPSVSVGNVPQFTVDLLISNYKFEKVGMVWHAALIPLVGADPYDENSQEICTACELFVNEDLRIATLQNRTSFHYKMLSVFLEDLKADLVKHEITEVVILSSAFDHELHKIDTGKLFYIDSSGTDTILERIGAKKLEPIDDKFVIQGGGYSIQTYETLRSVAHCSVLINYVSEGNNISDAISMMNIVSKYISNLKELSTNEIKIPHSWSGVFGSPPPIGMF